jgi:hypothetical protein
MSSERAPQDPSPGFAPWETTLTLTLEADSACSCFRRKNLDSAPLIVQAVHVVCVALLASSQARSRQLLAFWGRRHSSHYKSLYPVLSF